MTTTNYALYFAQPLCGVCEQLAPQLEELFARRYPLLTFEQIVMREQVERSASHQVFVAPALLVFFDGKEMLRFARHFSLYEVEQSLDRLYQLYYDA
ncbi:MAG: thioredoxin family protein [Bernardetiaceae bacterium]|nr:thioredoxin family protein [Bernardetiaceae bacterium]